VEAPKFYFSLVVALFIGVFFLTLVDFLPPVNDSTIIFIA